MEDWELVDRILHKGDTKSFGEIVKRFSGRVFPKVLGLVKDEDLAKDIVQQTFIRAYTNLDSWNGGSLGGWINAIAMNLTLNELDKIRRRRTEPLENEEADRSTEDYSEEHEDLLQKMDRAIDQLPETDRNIVRLHYYSGMKTEEMANVLKMSASNVLVKLHRIREKLRKEIEDERNE